MDSVAFFLGICLLDEETMVISGGILIWFQTMTPVYHNFTRLAETHETIDSFLIERN